MALRVDQVEEGGGKTLRVSGDVDMDSSPNLRDAILKALKATPSLTVDLSGVQYLDSSGVAVLIQGYKAAQEGTRKFVLRNPSAQVDAVIELARLEQLFTIERSGDS